MSLTDFQNGFALGRASGGKVTTGDIPKEEQEKTVDITENGTTEVLPDENKVLSKVTVNVDVASGAEDLLQYVTNANRLFYQAKTFPNKAEVNLPNATNIGLAFSEWDADSIPMVEEIIVKAPNVSNIARDNTDSVFGTNDCVKKVVLDIPNETKYLYKTFTHCTQVETIVLEFSTQNVEQYDYAFRQCSILKKIDGVLDFSSATKVTNMFLNCNNLEEVTFAANTLSLSISLANSSQLTSVSVQSIIDGLATVETAQTLTFNANTKILQSQVDSANTKGWTVAGGTVVTEEEYYG